MSLSAKQVKFVNEYAQDKNVKEVRDVVGFFYKDNMRKFIQEKRKPKSIKDILGLTQ